MGLKVTGTRQLITAPKGEKGDKGEDGNSFTPKGQAYGHFGSFDDFMTAHDNGQIMSSYPYLVDNPSGEYALVCRYYGHGSSSTTAEDGDAYTLASTMHMWAATGNVWVDFGEIQGPPGEDGEDGQDGEDAELYRLQLTEGWARWEKYGSGWRLKCCIKGNAWFIRGGTQMSATSGTGYEEQRIRIRYNNNKQLHFEPIAGDGSWTDDVAGKYLEDDEYGSSSVGQPECIIVELIGKDISDHTQVLDALTIAIAWDGEPGGKGGDGDPGPMGIPAGAYSSSARYERTSEIVPIVEHNGQYWYPKNVGVLTNSEPSANNSAWKKAENFEVMFVKILFAAFAKLGEAIFHGNFMFSQNGKVNGAASDNYQLFTPSDPDNEDNASRFAPNLYLNFLTGAARLAAGKAKFFADGRGSLAGGNLTWDANGNVTARGTIYATGGEFGGYIKTAFKRTSESDATVIGSDNDWPSHPIYQLNTDFNLTCDGGIIQLPISTSLIGTRAAFFGGVGTRMDPWTIRIRCNRGILGFPQEGENTGSSNSVTEITAAGGLIEMLCVDSDGDAIWCITSINVEYKYTNLDY